MRTIGFLLPRSTFYTGISFDLFEGLKSSLTHLDRTDIRIVTENIGFGAEKQQCYRSAEHLIMHENAEIVVAYIGHRMAQVLRPLFMAANRLLIVLDAGVHLPQEWPVSPNIYYHSLHNSLGAWLSSVMAIRDGHTNGGITTGYYDGGYLHTIGSHNGYVSSGGTIGFTIATGYRSEDFSMQPLKEQFDPSTNSCVFSLFSGDYVQWFFKELNLHFPGQNIPVYLPPFAFEESMLKDAEYPGNHVKGTAAWSKKLSNKENETFIETLQSTGRAPNLFSLLGWESASIIVFLLDQLSTNRDFKAAGEALNDFSFDSPRGLVTFHAESHCSIAPLYEAKIVDDGTGHCAVEIIEAIPGITGEYEKLLSQDLGEAVSGWYNSYTCI